MAFSYAYQVDVLGYAQADARHAILPIQHADRIP